MLPSVHSARMNYGEALLDALGGPEADTRDCVFLPLGHDRDVAARLRAVGWRTVAAVSDGDDAAALADAKSAVYEARAGLDEWG